MDVLVQLHPLSALVPQHTQTNERAMLYMDRKWQALCICNRIVRRLVVDVSPVKSTTEILNFAKIASLSRKLQSLLQQAVLGHYERSQLHHLAISTKFCYLSLGIKVIHATNNLLYLQTVPFTAEIC